MEPISDATALLTTGGVTAAVYVIMQFLAKPWLRRKYPDQGADYEAVMNTVAAAIGVMLAEAAALGLTPRPEWTAELFLTAFLVGIGGAFLAVGLHEVASNVNRARRTG